MHIMSSNCSLFVCLFVWLAWDLTVSLMEAGEVALVQTTPRFAYGRQGR